MNTAKTTPPARASLLVIAILFVSLFLHRSHAGVIVTQNVAPGATSWPGTPILSTMANPSSTATVNESFTGGGGCTSYGQTFIVAGSNYILDTINLYVGSGTGTSASAPVTINLYDLGVQSAPDPSPYTPTTNLLGGGNGLPITYVTQSPGVLKLDFTDADRVTLLAGHMYAFEIQGAINTTPLFWYRNVSDTFPGGAAYRNRTWINGTNARDFGLAVYGTATFTPPPSTDVVWTDVRQTIDGFGAGVVFLDRGLDPITNGVADACFGTTGNQFGLSLMRIRISSTGDNDDHLLDAQKAIARGARVIASPWSPPAGMKDNNSTIDGYLKPTEYANYANYLNNFATNFIAATGVPLAAISIQNEPDIDVDYESCWWTPEQLRTFARDNAGAITAAPVMMPESFHYDKNYSDPTLNDPAAASNVDFIGLHLYGAGVTDYPLARNLGKRIWQTEYLINDQTWPSAMSTATQIHNCMDTGNMSAYIWWKVIDNDNGLLNAQGAPQKRGFVMAQFSRFVRPGFVRIGTWTEASSLLVTAYKNPSTGDFAIVALNGGTESITQQFNLEGFGASSVTPWITSSVLSLASQAPVSTTSNANGASFSYAIAPSSIVTFVGKDGSSTNFPPAAPSGLTATAASSSQINLSWTDNSGDETGFEVDQASNSTFSQNLLTTTVGANSTSHTASGLASSTTYYFRVRATNSAGDSANSNIASATSLGDGSSIHVSVVNVSIFGSGSKKGRVQVTVVNSLGQPVAGATVTGNFSGTINETGRSGTTDASGVATITTNASAKGNLSVTFCVTNVTHPSLTYNAAANEMTCDSL